MLHLVVRDPLLRRVAWNLHDDVQALGVVVHDAESDTVVVDAGRDLVVRVGRLEHAGRMVVHEHLSALRKAG